MPTQLFRNSALLVPARLIKNTLKIMLLSAALWGWGSKLPGVWPAVLTAIVVLIITAYIFEPFFAVFFKRLQIVANQIVLHTGAVMPTERTSTLETVSSVQIDEPWDLRFFGLASVTIVAQGAESSAFVMQGLSRKEALRLVSLVDPAANSKTTAHDSPLDAPAHKSSSFDSLPAPVTQALPHFRYVATHWDLIATVVTQGSLIVTGIALFGTIEGVSNFFGVDFSTISTLDVRIFVLIAFALLLASGAIAVMTFRGFTISSLDGASYEIAYGLISRTSHTILRNQVVAVEVVTTPLDVLFGTQRVSLSTAKLSHSPIGKVKFPSIRRHEAVRVIREITGASLPDLAQLAPKRWLIVPFLILLMTLTVVTLLPHPSVWITVIEALAVFVAAVNLLRYVTGQVQVATDGSHLTWTQVGVAHTTTLYSAGSTRAVMMRRIPPFSGGHLVLISFAHRRQVLRKLVSSGKALTEIRKFQQFNNTVVWAPVVPEVET